ncbi:MAG: glycosyltransferase [Clostridia bacterium]|nr:glycosyltransferase [Clostridia bacterium]MBR6517078.1 glycosyltransferase [Bacilli bacterium]
MIKLSIIIPYYETYELTVKLLKELSIQVNDEVEVILTDNNCNETRLDAFNFVKIIHMKENVGVSAGRNVGLKEAKGKYVAFIDSDDMITNDYIEVLLKAIDERNEDVIYFNWADFNENLIIRHPQNYAVWKAIYKREICPMFQEDKMFNEDVFFQEDLHKTHKSIYYIDRVLYIYNSGRIGSQMWRRDNGKM